MKTIEYIENELEQTRKLIIAKIKEFLSGHNESHKLEVDLDKIGDITYVYYTDSNGDPHEGSVEYVWIENGLLAFRAEFDNFSYDFYESDYEFATRTHEWLLGILRNVCDMLNINPDKINFEQ